MAVDINVLVEGPTDEAIARRVLTHVGLPCGTVYGKAGKQHLLARLPSYNEAARRSRWLVIVDLDNDDKCAPPFVQAALPTPSSGMQLRVAVRAIESWLLADADRLAASLGISPAVVPRDPDMEENPKCTLVNLARRSRRKAIRGSVVPRPGSGADVGPGYLTWVTEFVAAAGDGWRPEVAAEYSDSLRRCVSALRRWSEDSFVVR